ncbi:hypothetical protein B0H14DRAFT_2580813 [Mycena olivaceomarginata]|nr:hypothetical protein B0H14DRAFT_2580813 [Mycena olivaceomarginata]
MHRRRRRHRGRTNTSVSGQEAVLAVDDFPQCQSPAMHEPENTAEVLAQSVCAIPAPDAGRTEHAHALLVAGQIGVPTQPEEAHALQTRTVIHRAKTAASEEHPTVRATSAVADILHEENTAIGAGEEEAVPEEDVDDSGSNIDTDMSSDSGDEDIEDLSSLCASTNLAALGEQALAWTIYELQDVVPRLGDLAEFMKRKSGPLATNEHLVLVEGRGHLAALMAELDRLLFATPVPTNAAQPTQAPVLSLSHSGNNTAMHNGKEFNVASALALLYDRRDIT